MAAIEITDRQQEEMEAFEAHLRSLKKNPATKLDHVLRGMFGRHKAAFIAKESERWLRMPDSFINDRLPNETVEEFYKRTMRWPSQRDQSAEATRTRGQIRDTIDWMESVVFWLTTHPVYANRNRQHHAAVAPAALPGFWRDKAERENWQENDGRKPFKVRLKDDAPHLTLEYAEAEAERVMRHFILKAVQKLLPILKRHPDYFPRLLSGDFDAGAVEGDVRLTFTDTRCFVVHVMVKENVSLLGTPYYQYPLTFHEIYEGERQPPVKTLAQAEVEAMFGVEDAHRWTPPPSTRRTIRWKAAKSGDVVRVRGKRPVALVLGGDRKKKENWRVCFSSGKEASVPKIDCLEVVSRIEIGREWGESLGGGQRATRWSFTLLNGDFKNTDKSYFATEQSQQLHSIYTGTKGGNYRLAGARMAFDVLVREGYVWPTGGVRREAAVA